MPRICLVVHDCSFAQNYDQLFNDPLQKPAMPVIGFLRSSSLTDAKQLMAAFRQVCVPKTQTRM